MHNHIQFLLLWNLSGTPKSHSYLISYLFENLFIPAQQGNNKQFKCKSDLFPLKPLMVPTAYRRQPKTASDWSPARSFDLILCLSL